MLKQASCDLPGAGARAQTGPRIVGHELGNGDSISCFGYKVCRGFVVLSVGYASS